MERRDREQKSERRVSYGDDDAEYDHDEKDMSPKDCDRPARVQRDPFDDTPDRGGDRQTPHDDEDEWAPSPKRCVHYMDKHVSTQCLNSFIRTCLFLY